MAHEAFEDEATARRMNQEGGNVKVDREERPDVDAIYMNALSAYNRLTRNVAGVGWPLSMFRTPNA